MNKDICDLCMKAGKPVDLAAKVHKVSIPTGTVYNGVDRDTEASTFDICEAHLARLFLGIVGKVSYSEASEIISQIRGMQG